MPTSFLKQSQREFKIFRKETLYQPLLKIILNKTLSISTSLESSLLPEFHNLDSKAREIPEFNHQSKLAPKFPPRDKTTKAKQHKGSFPDIKRSNITQGNHQQEENEATKDLLWTQKALMFMLIKTSCTTVNSIPNTRLQVTKKMPQQTFHQGHRWEGTN